MKLHVKIIHQLKKICKKVSTQFCSHTYFGYGPDLLRIGIFAFCDLHVGEKNQNVSFYDFK